MPTGPYPSAGHIDRLSWSFNQLCLQRTYQFIEAGLCGSVAGTNEGALAIALSTAKHSEMIAFTINPACIWRRSGALSWLDPRQKHAGMTYKEYGQLILWTFAQGHTQRMKRTSPEQQVFNLKVETRNLKLIRAAGNRMNRGAATFGETMMSFASKMALPSFPRFLRRIGVDFVLIAFPEL